MSDEHMATAREVTRDWTPQTTLADSRRDIANALAAAEERGRRSSVEERDELRKLLRDVRPLVNETWLNAGPMTERGWEYLLGRIDAAISPPDSAPQPMEGAPCTACGAAFGTHANWCHRLNATNNVLAPRDAAPASVCLNCGKVDGHWPKCPSYQAPRDSAPGGDCQIVGCQIIGKHDHPTGGPSEARK